MKFYQEQKVNPLGLLPPARCSRSRSSWRSSTSWGLSGTASSPRRSDQPGQDPGFLFIPDLAEKLTSNIPVLAIMVVLYIGTQLASTAVTAISADPTQRKIMFALPFVFTLFVINFPAGLLLYWITTNTWTIGQQLLVRKLYPKPEPIEATDDDDNPRPRAGSLRRRRPRRPTTARTARRPSSRPPASGPRPPRPRRAATGRRPPAEPRPSRRPRRARSASAPAAGGSGSLRRVHPRRPGTASATWSPRSATGSASRASASSCARTTRSCGRRSTARTSAC